MFGVAEATLFGLAAALSSVVGVVLAILSHRAGAKSAERKAEQETHEQLMAARSEAEALSAELHKMKLERNNVQPEEPS